MWLTRRNLQSTQPAFWPVSPLRRTSVLLQGEFTSPEHFNHRRVERPTGAKPKRKCDLSKQVAFSFGGLEGDRTLDLCDANQPPKLFSSISGRFYPFSLRPSSSLDLLGHTVSVWSGAVCGRFCGQKRSPALAGVFRRQGWGAFFIPLTAWIVTLRAELNKSFLCSP